MRGGHSTSQAPARRLTVVDVRLRLGEVLDPELGVGIVDLGLVYGVTVDDEAITVTMTMTTPVCPLGPYLTDTVRAALEPHAGGRQVVVEGVWDPPWCPEMMNDAARVQLGWCR